MYSRAQLCALKKKCFILNFIIMVVSILSLQCVRRKKTQKRQKKRKGENKRMNNRLQELHYFNDVLFWYCTSPFTISPVPVA